MEQIANNPDADGLDMTELYTTLIEAWAYSNEPERAEEILDFMQTTYEKGDSVDPLLCGPPLRAFNAILLAYARLGRSDAPQQAMRFVSSAKAAYIPYDALSPYISPSPLLLPTP